MEDISNSSCSCHSNAENDDPSLVGIGDKERVLQVQEFKAQVQRVLSRAHSFKQQPDKSKLDLKSLTEDCKQAERFFKQLSDLDNGVPLPDYIPLAEHRRAANLSCIPPSEIKVLVYNCVRATRFILASALEARGEWIEALPIYQRILSQCVAMREDLWDDPSETRVALNNVAICAARSGATDQAKVWYRNGLELCRWEEPDGCEEEALLRHNFEAFLGGTLAGPPGVGIQEAGGQHACWGCGATKTTLSKCARCTEGGHLFIVAKYCSRDCQMKDWKRHKQYHKMVAPVAEIIAEQDRPEAIEINEAGYVKGVTIPGAYMMKSSISSV